MIKVQLNLRSSYLFRVISIGWMMKRRIETSLPIGAVAARTGLSVSAIRYYEAQGLIACERSAGGQRRFARAVIRRLSFILIAQKLGLSLEEISSALQ